MFEHEYFIWVIRHKQYGGHSKSSREKSVGRNMQRWYLCHLQSKRTQIGRNALYLAITSIKICSSIVNFFQNFVQYWYTSMAVILFSNVIQLWKYEIAWIFYSVLDCFILEGSQEQLLQELVYPGTNISTIPITILTTILYTSKKIFCLNHNTGTILVYNTGTNFYTSIVIAKYRRSNMEWLVFNF